MASPGSSLGCTAAETPGSGNVEQPSLERDPGTQTVRPLLKMGSGDTADAKSGSGGAEEARMDSRDSRRAAAFELWRVSGLS